MAKSERWLTRSDRAFLIAGMLVLAGALMVRMLASGGSTPDTAQAGEGGGGIVAHVEIYFTSTDCGSDIEALHFWNQPFAEGAVAVAGHLYTVGSDPNTTFRIVRGAGLTFPVREIDRRNLARVRGSLGYEHESFVIIRDTDLRIRFSQPLAELASPRARAFVLELLARMEEGDVQQS